MADLGALDVSIHALPILNVTDHYTRTALQHQGDAAEGPVAPVYGALLGTQSGRRIEICNSFEFVVSAEHVIDATFFEARRDQYRQVFPTFDVLGWYSVGHPNDTSLVINRNFTQFNDTPLVLMLDIATIGSRKDLPISVYETVLDVHSGDPQLVRIDHYSVETGEAERIAVDHVAKSSQATVGASSGRHAAAISTLKGQYRAIKMLQDRVSVITKYIQAVGENRIEPDLETLRQIGVVVNRISSLGKTDEAGYDEYKDEFLSEYSDVLLTKYLTVLTQHLDVTNKIVDKQLITDLPNKQTPGTMQRPTRRVPQSNPRGSAFKSAGY